MSLGTRLLDTVTIFKSVDRQSSFAIHIVHFSYLPSFLHMALGSQYRAIRGIYILTRGLHTQLQKPYTVQQFYMFHFIVVIDWSCHFLHNVTSCANLLYIFSVQRFKFQTALGAPVPYAFSRLITICTSMQRRTAWRLRWQKLLFSKYPGNPDCMVTVGDLLNHTQAIPHTLHSRGNHIRTWDVVHLDFVYVLITLLFVSRLIFSQML